MIYRFSLPGGNPLTPDYARAPRGFAAQFSLSNGSKHNIATLNVPVFAAKDPETFLGLLQASVPGADGKPDMAKLTAFKAAHPDTKPLEQWLASHQPPFSYTTAEYFGIHTFYLNNKQGEKTKIRWHLQPHDGVKGLTEAEIAKKNPDFLNQRLAELLTSLSDYTAGVLLVLLASTVWTFYAMGQKQLLTVWNSLQVMMVIYLFCGLLLTPWVHPLEALQLNPLQGWLLLACCMNTLIAYGAFAEALAHWEASRVSATLAITPLVTFGAVAIAAWMWPEFVHAETINGLAYGGAILVVLGSALVALGPSLIAGLRARRARVAAG